MDREGASFEGAVSSIRKKLKVNAIPIQFPIGKEKLFEGVVDLLTMLKLTWASGSSRNPEKPVVSPLSTDDPDYESASQARSELLEAIAECDDKFMEVYLEHPERLTLDYVLSALRRECVRNQIVPVLCGASLRGKGVEPLLDSILAFLPSPADRVPEVAVSKENNKIVRDILPLSKDLCALAFKVTYDEMRGPLVFAR
jgi:elongation factor G